MNHSYWSYVHQLSYRLGAHIIWLSIINEMYSLVIERFAIENSHW